VPADVQQRQLVRPSTTQEVDRGGLHLVGGRILHHLDLLEPADRRILQDLRQVPRVGMHRRQRAERGVVVVGGGKDEGVAPHHCDILLLHSWRTRASSGPIPPTISITSSAPSKLSRTLRFAERSTQA
jgi:hypothetical protein